MIVTLDIWLIFAATAVLLICFKVGFLSTFVRYRNSTGFDSPSPLIAIVLAVAGMIMCDVTLISHCMYKSYLPGPSEELRIFLARIAHALLMIQYQALSALLFTILRRSMLQYWAQKLFFVTTLVGALSYIHAAFFGQYIPKIVATTFQTYDQFGFGAVSLESKITLISCFLLPIALAVSMLVAYRFSMHRNIPLLIQQQIRVLIFHFMIPFLVLECIQILFFLMRQPHIVRVPFLTLGSFVFSCALWYFKDKLLRLRFLGLRPHVVSVRQRAFLENNASLIRQVEAAEGIEVLGVLSGQFCATTFSISVEHVHMYAPDNLAEGKNHAVLHQLSTHCFGAVDFLRTARVINRHDLEFDLFYRECPVKRVLLGVCCELSATVLVPLFSNDQLIGCISVEPPDVNGVMVDAMQREELILFAGYLQAALVHIELTRYRRQQERYKKAVDVLKVDHRKLAHIRRTIQAKLKGELSQEIALIASRSGALVPLNRFAQELLASARTDNTSELISTCKKVAASVEKYKTAKRLVVMQHMEQLSVAGSPSINHTGIIVTVSRAGLLEALHEHPGFLLGSDHWEYVLCLDSNEMSDSLERFMPGQAHALVEQKIEILRAALQSLPLWISAPREDKRAIVELVHSLGERKELVWYTATEQADKHNFIDVVFGVDEATSSQTGLVAQYDRIGTIVIENVDMLSHEAQEALALFCASGEYRPRHSQQIRTADVRIIMTTRGQALSELTAAQKLLPRLVDQLYELRVYPLQELSNVDCIALANGLLEQHATADICKHVKLTDQEAQSLLYQRPLSLKDLHHSVRIVLERRQKHSKTNLYNDQAAVLSSSNKLVQAAARLGKKALSDQVLMTALWKQYGSQQHIAQILGVNRSSVSRRCKEYDLA